MEKITANTIGNISLEDKAKEYETASAELNDDEAKIALEEFALKTWLKSNFPKLALEGKMTDLYEDIKVIKPEKIDKIKTKAAQAEYTKLVSAVVNAKITHQKKQRHLTNIKNYIVFLKEIAGLVAKGGKPQQNEPKEDKN